MLEITFPNSASSEANVLTRRLRSELADAGVPVDRIESHRTDPEYMVDVDMLRLALDAVAVVAGHTVGETIFHFAMRNRSGIRIKGPFGQIDVNPGKEDTAQLADFLHNLAELFHDRSDK